VIRLLPPLVIGFDLLDDALAVLAEAITVAENTVAASPARGAA
jgi:4-aminobutyrate aminotransferase-like enzyme